MKPQSRVCGDCKFCIFEDYGYSNYTVEGTYFICAKEAHPDGIFDRFYGEDERLKYAEKCPEFTEGECIVMDVDHDNEETLTPEQKEIFREYHTNESLSKLYNGLSKAFEAVEKLKTLTKNDISH